jgi:hypothetical protein
LVLEKGCYHDSGASEEEVGLQEIDLKREEEVVPYEVDLRVGGAGELLHSRHYSFLG